LIIGLITLWRDYKIRQLEISGNLHLAALLKPIVLITKIIVAVVAALVWAHNAGFNVSTLIAGLGVGSLAIALAAQRTMENVIGAATLYAARPIRPGDLCRFGDITGIVEEIGLRSVTLRSLDRTLVSIPNSKFAAEQIENISVRDRIRFFKRLQLQMPTSEQLRVILGELREMLAAHPRIQQDTVSVRLENIEAANAVLRLDSGIVTQDFQDYLAVAEDLNLRIIEIVHANGAIFSGPGQVLQLREFHQASDELMAEVRSKLDTWRDNKQFPFPDVSDDRKAEIEASLTYPPLGSGQDTRDK
jgi:MscS family membrane protein